MADTADTPKRGKNDALLKQIRERFVYARDAWKDIREEAKTDMRYVSGDPWDPLEKEKRQKNHQPTLVFDEISQFTNQLINDIRQNPRAIKVIPIGAGANDKTAELRGNWIRGIEYRSNAQSAYIAGFQNAVERSYGWWRLETEYESDKSFNQTVLIKRIPNPDTVLCDPDCKELDTSDKQWCFVIDSLTEEKFTQDFPSAQIKSFTDEVVQMAPDWLRDKHVQIAEYWTVDYDDDTLLLLDDGSAVLESQFDNGKTGKHAGRKIEDQREVQVPNVGRYLTNGIEILRNPGQAQDREQWPGRWIPLIPVFGKELWVDEGGGSKRMLMSLVRLARDPYMYMCWIRSKEAAAIKITPDVPFIGAKGQFVDPEAWANISDEPRAYLEYDPHAGESNEALPPPQRPTYTPAVQPLEIAAESARRHIQAAMGSSPLPTDAQRVNEKSGAALKRIEQSEDTGTYHFINNYERAIEFTGRQLNDLWQKLIDTPRALPTRKPDGTHEVVQLTQQDIDAAAGEHEVTISTGPSFQSQREEASEFADALVGTPFAPLVADLIVKMKNLGPIGDEIAARLTPPQFANGQNIPPQLQGLLGQSQQTIQALQAEVQKLLQDKQAKVIEQEYALQRTKEDNATKVLIAEIETKAQNDADRAKWEVEVWKEVHRSAAEEARAAVQELHERRMAEMQPKKEATESVGVTQ